MVRLGVSFPFPPVFILAITFIIRKIIKRKGLFLVADRQYNPWKAVQGNDYDPGLGNQTDLGLGCAVYWLCGLPAASLGFSSSQLNASDDCDCLAGLLW